MKYGIYKFAAEKGMTYWPFSVDCNEEAEKKGFVKIGETRTRAEAIKVVYKLYKRDKRASRKKRKIKNQKSY